MRRSTDAASTVSQSVKSVTAAPTLSVALTPSAADHALAIWGEAEVERAAIPEYDGGIPRLWAEGFARLHHDRPPGDVPPKRWVALINDIGRFLDSQFCAIAAALGWGPH